MTETTLYPEEPAMSYSGQAPPSPSNGSSMKSGSQYAMAALGLGLVVLGVIMTMWNRVLTSPEGNSSKSNQVSSSSWSVALVLLCTGITFLLLSLLLGMYKRRRRRGEQQSNGSMQSELGERQTEAERFAVPSYDEVVASDQYPIRRLSDLPAYDDLMEPRDGDAAASKRRNGRAGLNPLPLRERRIKSDNMDRTKSSSSPQLAVSSIEPITPPPQYDANPPELPCHTYRVHTNPVVH